MMLRKSLAAALDSARLFRAAVGAAPDPWQADLLRSMHPRRLVLSCRQAGKSTTTACLALSVALSEPESLVLMLAPALRQSLELFGKVTDQYGALGAPVAATKATASELRLANGSRIVALPGSERTIRGYSGARLLIVDEASRVDDDLYFSVRPMLAISGGSLVMLTTPFGARGAFHEAWQHGDTDWERTRITAHECPRISPAFLEEERRQLGERWYRQEYLCSFEDAVGAVFDYGAISGAFDPTVAPLFGR